MGLTRSFNFEDARGRVDGETVALGIVFAGHPVVEGILIFAVEITIELHHPGGELRGPLRLGIKHERWAPGSAMPTNRLWRPPGRQQMAVSSTAPPRRTRSAEAGPHSGARRCSSALVRRCRCLGSRSNGLPTFATTLPVPAPLALVPRGLVSTQGGGPGNKSNGFPQTSPREKNTGRVYKDPLPPLPLVLCAGFSRRPSWSRCPGPPAPPTSPAHRNSTEGTPRQHE